MKSGAGNITYAATRKIYKNKNENANCSNYGFNLHDLIDLQAYFYCMYCIL